MSLLSFVTIRLINELVKPWGILRFAQLLSCAYATSVSVMDNRTRWYEYVLRVTEGMTAKEAAEHAGFDQSAMTRWKHGSKADPKFVVQFARAFNQNVLLALAESGLITDDEADLHEVKTGVRDLSTQQLLEELALRIDVKHGVRVNPETD